MCEAPNAERAHGEWKWLLLLPTLSESAVSGERADPQGTGNSDSTQFGDSEVSLIAPPRAGGQPCLWLDGHL